MTAPAVFLPGIIMPASLRYASLFANLEDEDVRAKELEIYAAESPPDDYSIALEVGGLDRYADEAGLERFHLYGHSAGGAVALAYVAAHPDRVISLGLDEPASDFTEQGAAGLRDQLRAFEDLPPAERTAAFLRAQVAPGVEVPPPPAGTAPPWMAQRPAAMEVFGEALGAHRVAEGSYERFAGPVYFSYGSLTAPRWAEMAERLGRHFHDYTAEEYEGRHHLNTSHQAEPERVASRLRALWARA